MGEETDIKKMKVSDLRDALAKRGLSTEGLKAELVNRLQDQLDLEEFGSDGLGDETNILPASVPSAPREGATNAIGIQDKSKVDDRSVNAPVIDATNGIKTKIVPVAGSNKITTSAEKKTAVISSESLDLSSAQVGNLRSASDSLASKGSVKSVPVSNATMSFEEKKAARASRFGMPQTTSTASFAEKKAARASRFGIPLVAVNDNEIKNGKSIKNKRQGHEGSEDGRKQVTDANNRKKSKTSVEADAEILLSKEEIEKRLKRAEKFGTGNSKEVDELKAMLRTYRFQKAE